MGFGNWSNFTNNATSPSPLPNQDGYLTSQSLIPTQGGYPPSQSLLLTQEGYLTSQSPLPAQDGYLPSEYIALIGTPIIVILGIIFNALSVALLRRPCFREMSTSVFLTSLAVCDTVSLCVNTMTKRFLMTLWDFNYSVQFASACSLYLYILFTARCIGAWLIVAVTLERILVTCRPLKAKIILTKMRAAFVTLCIVVMAMLMYSYAFVTWEVNSNNSCRMKVHYIENGFDVARKMADLVIFGILPSVILFVSNAVLIYKVMKSSRFRSASIRRDGTAKRTVDTSRRLTITLVTVSTAFMVLTLPLPIFYAYIVRHRINMLHHPYDVINCVLNLLQLTNNAINFFLYCISGPRFRKELRSMFCGTKRNSSI